MPVNAGVADLGHLDLLVHEGFCSSLIDLRRMALCRQLALLADRVRQTLSRRVLVVGLQPHGCVELDPVVVSGQRLQIRVVGLARTGADVTLLLALALIEAASVLGAFRPPAVARRALAHRIRVNFSGHLAYSTCCAYRT